jgi:hypothetical protein
MKPLITQFPVTSSLLNPNFFLRIIVSNILRRSSYLHTRYQDTHTHTHTHIYIYIYIHKATDKIIVLCILIFVFLDSKLEDRRYWTGWQYAFPDC